jgi:hypothetical protein
LAANQFSSPVESAPAHDDFFEESQFDRHSVILASSFFLCVPYAKYVVYLFVAFVTLCKSFPSPLRVLRALRGSIPRSPPFPRLLVKPSGLSLCVMRLLAAKVSPLNPHSFQLTLPTLPTRLTHPVRPTRPMRPTRYAFPKPRAKTPPRKGEERPHPQEWKRMQTTPTTPEPAAAELTRRATTFTRRRRPSGNLSAEALATEEGDEAVRSSAHPSNHPGIQLSSRRFTCPITKPGRARLPPSLDQFTSSTTSAACVTSCSKWSGNASTSVRKPTARLRQPRQGHASLQRKNARKPCLQGFLPLPHDSASTFCAKAARFIALCSAMALAKDLDSD